MRLINKNVIDEFQNKLHSGERFGEIMKKILFMGTMLFTTLDTPQ